MLHDWVVAGFECSWGVFAPECRELGGRTGQSACQSSAADPADETVDELVALYRAVAGEHPDWDEFRRDMAVNGRPTDRLHFDHAYGMVPTSGADE
jgi:hypothetical protein